MSFDRIVECLQDIAVELRRPQTITDFESSVLGLVGANIETSKAARISYEESIRPSRRFPIYTCSLSDGTILVEYPMNSPAISVSGKTMEEACLKFDHVWYHGNLDDYQPKTSSS